MSLFSDIEIRFRNKVCRSELGCPVTLGLLRSSFPSRYSIRENFPGLVFRPPGRGRKSPTVLIFPNGSLIITGEDSDEAIRQFIGEVVSDLRSLGFRPKEDFNLRVVNMVAQFRLRRHVDIAGFAGTVQGARLDRSRFPAVTWRDPETGCTFRLFRSGAGVVLGPGGPERLKRAVYNLYLTVGRLTTASKEPIRESASSKGETAESSVRTKEEHHGGVYVDLLPLVDILTRILGPSMCKTVTRTLEALAGKRESYSILEVAQVLSQLLGEEPARLITKIVPKRTRG
jgi:TATA-box binding protein (TBP) (component of TFIID and TFIIIB)